MMYSAFSSSSLTRPASASAAAIFISSLMSLARTSSAPRKMPGNAETLLIWLGKSLRPVPTTAAPASLARSGMISGVGLAMGNRMAPGAMVLTISGVKRPGALTPRNTSAPTSISASVPLRFSGFVTLAISAWAGVRPSMPS